MMAARGPGFSLWVPLCLLFISFGLVSRLCLSFWALLLTFLHSAGMFSFHRPSAITRTRLWPLSFITMSAMLGFRPPPLLIRAEQVYRNHMVFSPGEQALRTYMRSGSAQVPPEVLEAANSLWVSMPITFSQALDHSPVADAVWREMMMKSPIIPELTEADDPEGARAKEALWREHDGLMATRFLILSQGALPSPSRAAGVMAAQLDLLGLSKDVASKMMDSVKSFTNAENVTAALPPSISQYHLRFWLLEGRLRTLHRFFRRVGLLDLPLRGLASPPPSPRASPSKSTTFTDMAAPTPKKAHSTPPSNSPLFSVSPASTPKHVSFAASATDPQSKAAIYVAQAQSAAQSLQANRTDTRSSGDAMARSPLSDPEVTYLGVNPVFSSPPAPAHPYTLPHLSMVANAPSPMAQELKSSSGLPGLLWQALRKAEFDGQKARYELASTFAKGSATAKKALRPLPSFLSSQSDFEAWWLEQLQQILGDSQRDAQRVRHEADDWAAFLVVVKANAAVLAKGQSKSQAWKEMAVYILASSYLYAVSGISMYLRIFDPMGFLAWTRERFMNQEPVCFACFELGHLSSARDQCPRASRVDSTATGNGAPSPKEGRAKRGLSPNRKRQASPLRRPRSEERQRYHSPERGRRRGR